jgi:hypothetical protein
MRLLATDAFRSLQQKVGRPRYTAVWCSRKRCQPEGVRPIRQWNQVRIQGGRAPAVHTTEPRLLLIQMPRCQIQFVQIACMPVIPRRPSREQFGRVMQRCEIEVCGWNHPGLNHSSLRGGGRGCRCKDAMPSRTIPHRHPPHAHMVARFLRPDVRVEQVSHCALKPTELRARLPVSVRFARSQTVP